MVTDEQARSSHQVMLHFSDDAYRLLQNLAALKGKSISETVRDSLALEKMFQDTQREGGRVLVEHGDNVQELINR